MSFLIQDFSCQQRRPSSTTMSRCISKRGLIMKDCKGSCSPTLSQTKEGNLLWIRGGQTLAWHLFRYQLSSFIIIDLQNPMPTWDHTEVSYLTGAENRQDRSIVSKDDGGNQAECRREPLRLGRREVAKTLRSWNLTISCIRCKCPSVLGYLENSAWAN